MSCDSPNIRLLINPNITLFPYTTLFRSTRFVEQGWSVKKMVREMILSHTYRQSSADNAKAYQLEDRKSTRLNSSHLVISYAVFLLNKKKRTYNLLRLFTL